MKEDASIPPDKMVRRTKNQATSHSRDKSIRIMLLAILFQITWPMRLTKEEIFERLHYYGVYYQASSGSYFCIASWRGENQLESLRQTLSGENGTKKCYDAGWRAFHFATFIS